MNELGNSIVDAIEKLDNTLEKSNRIMILDRSLANGDISEEYYISELHKMYSL